MSLSQLSIAERFDDLMLQVYGINAAIGLHEAMGEVTPQSVKNYAKAIHATAIELRDCIRPGECRSEAA